MTEDPEVTLALALRAAADAYCSATGKRFDAEFCFLDATSFTDSARRYVVGQVRVTTTDEVVA